MLALLMPSLGYIYCLLTNTIIVSHFLRQHYLRQVNGYNLSHSLIGYYDNTQRCSTPEHFLAAKVILFMLNPN